MRQCRRALLVAVGVLPIALAAPAGWSQSPPAPAVGVPAAPSPHKKPNSREPAAKPLAAKPEPTAAAAKQPESHAKPNHAVTAHPDRKDAVKSATTTPKPPSKSAPASEAKPKPPTASPAAAKPAPSAPPKPEGPKAIASSPAQPKAPATPRAPAAAPSHTAKAAGPGGKAAAKPATKPAPPAEAAKPPAAPSPLAETPAELPKGSATGLPLPRFAALRSDEVNMRAGPGTRYPIDWVYKRRDLPVEIQREFEVWRLVSDPDGGKGWVHQATLTGRRSFIVIGAPRELRDRPDDGAAAAARLKPGVVGHILHCDAGSDWCRVQVDDYRGWLKRQEFWGTLKGEAIN